MNEITPSWVWLNGTLCDLSQATVNASDRGFLLADGLFETIRVKEGCACHLPQHAARLGHGCTVLGLAEPIDFVKAVKAVIEANDISRGSVRVTWTRGVGTRGILPSGQEIPTLLVTAQAAPAWQDGAWTLITCTGTRRNALSPLSRIKSLNYGDGLLARREAAALAAHDAILMNGSGRVAETTIATLFVYVDGLWVTPPVSDGALPGIRRQIALEHGMALEQSLCVGDLARADAMVLTNALMVQAVGFCDGRTLPRMDKAMEWCEDACLE